jgi:putative ABC transport system ATP-binding protein
MPSAREPVIRLEGIGKVFSTDEVETHALQDIDMHIGKGEFVAIAGPSGCGKSTLLAIVGLLEDASSGNYFLAGEEVSDLSPRQRPLVRNREIGFVFQSFNLIGELTVFENVELPLVYRGMAEPERRRKVLDALERVGLAHRAEHRPLQLSGGQQQRTAVARAVVAQPAVLLADEPTGNLDSKNGDQIMSLLADLHRQGATICMVTHDERFAALTDRTISLFDGRISPGPRLEAVPRSTPLVGSS